MKPCMNVDCPYYYNHKTKNNCRDKTGIEWHKILCPKYTDKKSESAWGMFWKLLDKYGAIGSKRINKANIVTFIKWDFYEIAHKYKNEQEAIKIMKEIEKDIK